ncbi:hypothetical protein [Deinococcus xinjiangensis]|uniref:hypothetical protein n=1 Tax=Deinococcus xinjiangensis TaxID=457454 RepID=UPI003365846D
MHWLTRLLALFRRPNRWCYDGESCTPSAHTLTERELRHSRLRSARTPLERLAQ